MMNLKTLSMITLTAAFLYGCSDSGSTNNGGTGGTGNSSTGGNGGTNATGGGGGVGNTGGGAATCTNTDNNGLDATTAANNFFSAVYGFGDGDAASANPSTAADPGTTFCLDSPADGQMCMNGLGQNACGTTTTTADCDYHRWGAGIGLNLAMHTDTAVTAFDAAAAGVTGVKFTLSGVTAPIRVQVTMVDDPATTTSNESTGFVLGGGAADITADGTVTAQFSEFTQPPWGCTAANTANPCGDGVDLAFDPTNLDALQFQVPTIAGATTSYDFCVSDIQLVDAGGNVVTPPAGSGGAGGGAP